MSENYVYIFSPDFCWLPARVVEPGEDTAIVSVPILEQEEEVIYLLSAAEAPEYTEVEIDLNEYPNKTLPLQNVDGDGDIKEVEDMATLEFVNEATIMYNIKARHLRFEPYTRAGDMVVAVNPFKWMNELYSPETREAYTTDYVFEEHIIERLEPHIYETSALAFKGLVWNGVDQSILVSGESGSGKTETVKLCLEHVASMQQGEASEFYKRVMDSNPLLEAFGNATTRRNNNASRFAKYVQLQFDRLTKSAGMPECNLAGSRCETYLLEKSRVVRHQEGERNFHIFHQLLASPDHVKFSYWKGLRGTDNESFAYVGFTETSEIGGVSDADRFQNTLDFLATIGIEGDKLVSVMKAVCIVLQLGNIVFGKDKDNEEKAAVESKKELKDLCRLSGLDENELKVAFTERTVNFGGEKTKVHLNVDAAKDGCDGLAKEIYVGIFEWLVQAINESTSAEANYKNPHGISYRSIGFLDIFGFESFDINGFEQLSINYASEKLQQKFTEDFFHAVENEYIQEGIPWDKIQYEDNDKVLALIEGKTGLLRMLNDECVLPKGTDTGFVFKAIKTHGETSPCMIAEKTFSPLQFGIRHFAGEVIYTCEEFVAKNNDTLPLDLLKCASKSTNEVVSKMLTAECSRLTSDAKDKSTRDSYGFQADEKKHQGMAPAQTVWSKYSDQLQDLLDRLGRTHARFIQCIKPNHRKQPLILDHGLTLEQLRCSGVVMAVTLAHSAYPNRMPNKLVLHRFRPLLPALKKPKHGVDFPDDIVQDQVRKLLAHLFPDWDETGETYETGQAPFAVGKTRTYFRAASLEFLEGERQKLVNPVATDIQRVARGYVVRRELYEARRVRREGATMIQSNWRCYKAKKDLVRRKSRKEKEAKIMKEAREREEKKRLANEKKEKERQAKEELEASKKIEDLWAKVSLLQQKYTEVEEKRIKEVADLEKEYAAKLERISGSGSKGDPADDIAALRKDHKKLKKKVDKEEEKIKELEKNRKKLKKNIDDECVKIEQLKPKVAEVEKELVKVLPVSKSLEEKFEKWRKDSRKCIQGYNKEHGARSDLFKGLSSMIYKIRDKCDDEDLVYEVDDLVPRD